MILYHLWPLSDPSNPRTATFTMFRGICFFSFAPAWASAPGTSSKTGTAAKSKRHLHNVHVHQHNPPPTDQRTRSVRHRPLSGAVQHTEAWAQCTEGNSHIPKQGQHNAPPPDMGPLRHQTTHAAPCHRQAHTNYSCPPPPNPNTTAICTPSWQLNTTHCLARDLARSLTVSVLPKHHSKPCACVPLEPQM